MTRKDFLLIVGAWVLIAALMVLCVVVINPALERRVASPCTSNPIEQKEAA